LLLERPKGLGNVSRPLLHAEVVSYSDEPSIWFVDCRMLHFPKEAGQHRNDLIFSFDFVALPVLTVVFERLNLTVIFDMVRIPPVEFPAQQSINLRQPASRKG
jgi:hypothetical protein